MHVCVTQFDSRECVTIKSPTFPGFVSQCLLLCPFICHVQSNKELQSVGGEVEEEDLVSEGEEEGEEPFDSEEEEDSDLEADPHRQK